MSNYDGQRSTRWAGVLARAYNNRGYVRRSSGCHYGAIADYERALPIWRATKIAIEHANTLNNLAFAKAQVGEFDTAWRLADDARKLRQEIGPREPVGLSLNTLAHVKVCGGDPEDPDEAIKYATRALKLFQSLHSTRGQGLALIVLAEAERRVSDWECYFPDQTQDWLQKAAGHAGEARDIFATLQVPARQVEALIELGCAYRDLVKFQYSRSQPVDKEKSQSEEAFQEAIRISDKKIIPRQVDALVNLSWLHYYVHENDTSLAYLDQAAKLIPSNYHLTQQQRGLDLHEDKEHVVVSFLVQLGKAELLRGQIAFDRFEKETDVDALREATEHYTLSLEYDMLLTDRIFRDMRRGMDRIYARLKHLSTNDMKVVYDAVTESEKTYKLKRSRMRRFLEENFGPSEFLDTVKLQ